MVIRIIEKQKAKKKDGDEKEEKPEDEKGDKTKDPIEVEDGPGKGKKNMGITKSGKMVPNPGGDSKNESVTREKIVNEVMRRVAKRIIRMKKGRK